MAETKKVLDLSGDSLENKEKPILKSIWESALQNSEFTDFLAEYEDVGELDPESEDFGVEISKRFEIFKKQGEMALGLVSEMGKKFKQEVDIDLNKEDFNLVKQEILRKAREDGEGFTEDFSDWKRSKELPLKIKEIEEQINTFRPEGFDEKLKKIKEKYEILELASKTNAIDSFISNFHSSGGEKGEAMKARKIVSEEYGLRTKFLFGFSLPGKNKNIAEEMESVKEEMDGMENIKQKTETLDKIKGKIEEAYGNAEASLYNNLESFNKLREKVALKAREKLAELTTSALSNSDVAGLEKARLYAEQLRDVSEAGVYGDQIEFEQHIRNIQSYLESIVENKINEELEKINGKTLGVFSKTLDGLISGNKKIGDKKGEESKMLIIEKIEENIKNMKPNNSAGRMKLLLLKTALVKLKK